MSDLANRLNQILLRSTLPDGNEYRALVQKTIKALASVRDAIRPPDRRGLPGGLIFPPPVSFTIIVPDLHARPVFLADILTHLEVSQPGSGTLSVLDALEAGTARLLLLGDGFHSERQCIDRWREAWRDYSAGRTTGEAMTAEMRDSLSLMEMVMELLSAYPDRAFFLKGNHENVLNEDEDGNHAFRKFADEGNMVLDFLLDTWGPDFVADYATFEKRLPLCLVCERFMASHAEPAFYISRTDLINAHLIPEVIDALTWTGNDASVPGTVVRMLDSFFPGDSTAVYFGGHRIVADRYALRAGGKFIQIHDPDSRTVAIADSAQAFDPERDIKEVP